MKKAERLTAPHDLVARLERYRRRIKAEGREKAVREIDQAIKDAKDSETGCA